MTIFWQLTINGILLGALYAAMALGFSTIWGVMRLINLAHGEFIMMGAYVAWFFFNPLREQNLTFSASTEPIPYALPILVSLLVTYIIWRGSSTFLKDADTPVQNITGIIVIIVSFIAFYWLTAQFSPVEIDITVLVFILLTIMAGFILSENVLDGVIKNRTLSRVVGVLVSAVLFTLLYLWWKNSEFVPLNLSMMIIIFVGLALAIGFIISHVILRYGLEWDITPADMEKGSGIDSLKQSLKSLNLSYLWQRRIIGYVIGAVISYGAYSFWKSMEFPHVDPFLSLPAIFIIFFALGYMVQKNFLNRVVEGPYLTMLLITFSISIILQNIGLQIYAADPRRINVEYGTALRLGDLTVPPVKLLTVIVSIAMAAGLVIFLRYTRIGYAIRAAAQNKMAARLMGINIHETYAITFGISIALTAMAGAMMGTFLPIAPINGPPWTLRAFSIVALGGLGKVEGVIAGGMLLGLAESYVGGYVGSNWQLPVAFIVLVIVLMVRPQGLIGGLLLTEED